MKRIKFLILLLTLFFIFVPRETYAEDYAGGFYTQYYNSADKSNTLTNTMGLGYHTGTAYTSNTDSWLTNYFYTDNLDLSDYRLGSLKIPFYVIYSPQFTESYIETYELSTCNCTQYVSNTCGFYSCSNNSDISDFNNFYNANLSFNFRLYYNNGNAWTFCNLEGSNINCPIPQDANTLYNITIFHKVIGTSAFSYKIALGRGIMIYINSSSAIIESQEDTTSAINDMNSNITNSSTDGNNITGSTNQIESMIPEDQKSQGFYNNIFTFYNRVNDSIDTTCSNYTLSLMNQTIVFPCVNMANIFGDWWTIIDLLCCIWPLFNIFNLIIGWVDGITDLEDLSYFKSAKHIHWSREDYRKGMYY